MIPLTPTAATRLSYALIGAVSGMATWALAEVVPDVIGNARIVLLLVAAGLGFFGVFLALLGPVRAAKAALAAMCMAAPAAALLLWASFRHARVDDFLGQEYAIAAFAYLLAIGVPFVVAGLHRARDWRHYGALFDAAWNLVVRVSAAWLFVGVVWLVLLLSDRLLGLVGIDLIRQLIELDPAPYLISGLALGLGIAIVHELRDYVSPFLVIQLLRVLLPALLLVLAVFILALPVRGLGNLFGTFSAAATLIAVTVAGITLVTTAIHRDDGLSVQGAGMLAATRALSVMLPVPAALALWAVWLRVGQYGLTPDRIAALIAAAVALTYALAYAGALLARADWRKHQRNVNRWMALVTLAIAALWLTPALNPERMSTASQIARIETGETEGVPALWEMAHAWGRAGDRGLIRLEARAEADGDAELLAAIARARDAPQRWAFETGPDAAAIAPLEGGVPLRPDGASLPVGALDLLDLAERQMIHDACGRTAPGGHPGCVIVVAAFEPELDARQAIGFFLGAGGSVRMIAYRVTDGALIAQGNPRDVASDSYPFATPAMIADIFEGRFRLAPSARTVLELGDMKLFPQN